MDVKINNMIAPKALDVAIHINNNTTRQPIMLKMSLITCAGNKIDACQTTNFLLLMHLTLIHQPPLYLISLHYHQIHKMHSCSQDTQNLW